MLKFPDISEWNPKADVAGILRQSGGHIILRAGYGPHKKDFMFDKFRAKCGNAKTVGIYHFVTRHGSVKANADSLIRWVGKLRANEYVVLDVEAGSSAGGSGGDWSKSECEDYMKRVRSALGGKVLIYANEYYASTGGRKSLFTSTQGWVAKYSSSKPSIPFLIWQSAGTINNVGVGSYITNWPGVGKNGDTNVVFVSEAQFMKAVLGGTSSGGSGPADSDHIFYRATKPQKMKKGEENLIHFDHTNHEWDPVVTFAFPEKQVMGDITLYVKGKGRFGTRVVKFKKGSDGLELVHLHPDHQFRIDESGESRVSFTIRDQTKADERMRVTVYPIDEDIEVTRAYVDTWQADF